MAEYIEREAVCVKCNNKEYCHKEKCPLYKAPAADVVEVRHGVWIIKTDYKTPLSHAYIRKEKLYVCPYCGKAYRQNMNFCGNCGAKMDGKGEGE